MNLVAFALRRPITVVVRVVASAHGHPRDPANAARYFPSLGIPVLYVAQPYGGMDPV